MKLLPERRAITSFGDGGFRFGDHSHRGHLLVLPSGMMAWDGKDFLLLLAEKSEIDFFVLGTGLKLARLDPALAQSLGAVQADAMTTSAAIHSYNYMLAEGRRVAAAFFAV
ncbi:MAG: Mth938-like domain-containing protein [Aestuariivirga sp.]